jgi:hypothetical protein
MYTQPTTLYVLFPRFVCTKYELSMKLVCTEYVLSSFEKSCYIMMIQASSFDEQFS